MSAYQNRYWAKTEGYITIERKTIALLTIENPSVTRVFEVLVSQAFTKNIAVELLDKTYEIWGAGARPWGYRGLSEACGLAVNTVRKAVQRLNKISLIQYVSSKKGTVIQVLDFHQYQKMNPNVGIDARFEGGRRKSFSSQRSDTPYVKTDHYRSSIKDSSSQLTSPVDVNTPAEEFFNFSKNAKRAADIVRSLTKAL